MINNKINLIRVFSEDDLQKTMNILTTFNIRFKITNKEEIMKGYKK